DYYCYSTDSNGFGFF
nr:immunoglobulin light chain junction region [Macaca mulatta]MOW28866.1 immunoglobulin light chain junction region [Macaca mulatta]MOW29285.1 immunoglobulin light chain junction region [Macaca mulatta]MOW30485.1 immunoglobulin light chain junction region [Macaca mulatta]MOW30669.1 immunoglobulin light chain junction region [Macaca mulatta]